LKVKSAIVFGLVFLGAMSVQAAPFGEIRSARSLPIHGVKMIESDKGVFFISENGRFAWKGPIYDMWNAKPVATIEDAETVVNHIDVKKIGVKPNDLATLSFGEGQQEEIIFVSSACPHCKKLLEQAVELGEQYRFHIILIPMGRKSMKQTRQLLCAPDQGRAVKALLTGDYEGLGSGDCRIKSLQRTLVAARILGIRSVPYLIRHDGQVKTGGVKNLAAWLAAAEVEGK